MYYYKKNIGDYYKKTGRLSMLEHGAYTLLIDACYDRERFPTLEDALDWTWARSDEEVEAVKYVLGKFFDLVDGFYVQKRIQDELDKYKKNANTNKRIAVEREEKRRARKNEACTDGSRCDNEAPPNQEPRTKNQEPLTSINNIDSDKPKRFDFKKALIGKGGNEESVIAFMAVRKTKKATNTEKAFDLFMNNVNKSNMNLNQVLEICIQRDWKGFDPSWLNNQTNNRGTDNFHDQFYGVGQSPFGKHEENSMRDIGGNILIEYDNRRF